MLNRPGTLLVLRRALCFEEEPKDRDDIAAGFPPILIPAETPVMLLEIIQNPRHKAKGQKIIRVLWDTTYLRSYMSNHQINKNFDIAKDYSNAEEKSISGTRLKVIKPITMRIPLDETLPEFRWWTANTRENVLLEKGDEVIVDSRLIGEREMEKTTKIILKVRCPKKFGNKILYQLLTNWRINTSFERME